MKCRYFVAMMLAIVFLCPSLPALAQEGGMTIDWDTGTLLNMEATDGGLCRIPEGVTAIAPGAFGKGWYIDWVQSLSLPLSMEVIEPYAFAVFTSLGSVSLPLTLREISEGAFRECIALERVVLPPSVKTVGALAFNGCERLREAYLPDGVEYIDPTAFDYAHEDLVIYAAEGSEGHVYAKAHGLNWAEPGGTPTRLERQRRPAAVINLPEDGAVADLRTAPSDQAESAARYPNGALVEMIAQEGDWWKVGIGPRRGYLPAESLMPTDALTGLIPLYFAELYPEQIDPTNPDAWINDWPHTYTYPSLDAPRTMSYDNPSVDILDAMGPWIYVDSPGQNTGYFPISKCEIYRRDEGDGRRYGIVLNPRTTDRLHLRSGPSKDTDSLGRYFSGAQMEILGEENGWFHVRLDGKTGYMLGEYVREVFAGKHWWEDSMDPNG